MYEKPEQSRGKSDLLEVAEDVRDAWFARLQEQSDLPEREFNLYVRYLRALALLCECAPYVDEEDYIELIDELLADASAHYPLDVHRDEHLRQIAPRAPRPRSALHHGESSRRDTARRK